MGEVQVLADHHPYLETPSTTDLGRWAACGLVGKQFAHWWTYRRSSQLQLLLPLNLVSGIAEGAFLGFCCVDPDSGDYGAWFAVSTEIICCCNNKVPHSSAHVMLMQQVNGLVARWQQPFSERGLHLSFQHTRQGNVRLPVMFA